MPTRASVCSMTVRMIGESSIAMTSGLDWSGMAMVPIEKDGAAAPSSWYKASGACQSSWCDYWRVNGMAIWLCAHGRESAERLGALEGLEQGFPRLLVLCAVLWGGDARVDRLEGDPQRLLQRHRRCLIELGADGDRS